MDQLKTSHRLISVWKRLLEFGIRFSNWKKSLEWFLGNSFVLMVLMVLIAIPLRFLLREFIVEKRGCILRFQITIRSGKSEKFFYRDRRDFSLSTTLTQFIYIKISWFTLSLITVLFSGYIQRQTLRKQIVNIFLEQQTTHLFHALSKLTYSVVRFFQAGFGDLHFLKKKT